MWTDEEATWLWADALQHGHNAVVSHKARKKSPSLSTYEGDGDWRNKDEPPPPDDDD